MYQALTINVLIIGLIFAGILITHNPLFIFALLLLQNMPFLSPEHQLLLDRMRAGQDIDEGFDEEDEDPTIGFTANVE